MTDHPYQLHEGDCLDVLAQLADHSVDAIVTDPPYGIRFMGKRWDYEVPGAEVWAQCLRVLKPGGHLLAFAGARTQHRMTVNIEDGGFEIRDMIAWLYGSGFPKSMDLHKAMDKAGLAEGHQWEGWGTALKPALEPITLARKPPAGTLAANVQAHGVGGLNIDGCRVATAESLTGGAGGLLSHQRDGKDYPADNGYQPSQLGRWPANLIHDGSDEVLALFPQAGAKAPVCGSKPSAARFFYCAKATKQDRDEHLEDLALASARDMTGRAEGSAGINNPRAGAGRTGGGRNFHPTVKPTALMRYLCRLITPPGGLILDPFMGSGSTGKAAMLDGYRFIGIEREQDYRALAHHRIYGAWRASQAT